MCIVGVFQILVVIFVYNDGCLCSYYTVIKGDMDVLGDYNIYYSLNRTREILMKYYNKSDEIKKLLDEYDFRCANSKVAYPKNFPFVTVEGNYRKTRNEVAQRLAKRIKGRMVGNPPQYMIMANYFFNDTTELRRAFYSLGVRAAACKVREFLASSPVIVAGYWIDQTAFGVVKMFPSLPPERSEVYRWPSELLKPDRVYMLNPKSSFSRIPLHPYKPLGSPTFKDKLLEAMKRFKNPSVTVINSSYNYDDAVRAIVQFMNTQFNANYNV